jgi:hypothetical protein
MDSLAALLASALLVGLAGSVHCACMCGGIASGALLLLDPSSHRERLASVLLLQAGRITTYAVAGGVVASVVSIAVDPQTTALSFRIAQWLAAVSLMWFGLSTAGMLPQVSLAGLGGGAISSVVDPVLQRLRRHRRLGPYALGLTWGLTPCPMVYVALFSAALMGQFWLGFAWMAAFGLGTLPGVVGAALGIGALARLKGTPWAEAAAGLSIAAFGFATLYYGWPGASLFCAPR